MLLSDRDIRRELSTPNGVTISPYRESALQPASYDLHLGPDLLLPVGDGVIQWSVDPRRDDPEQFWRKETLYENSGIYFPPGEFWLAHTEETVRLPNYLAGKLEGKSSLGRWGLVIHVTAGFVDPGFEGQLTLELHNVSKRRILLTLGMPISQIAFMLMSSAVEKPYDGRYQGSRGVVGARVRREPGSVLVDGKWRPS